MAAADPERWTVVDAAGDVDTVFARVLPPPVRGTMTDRRAMRTTSAGTGERVGRRRRPAGRRRPAAAGRRRPGPRLPVRRSVRLDEARGGPGVRRGGARRATTTPAGATPGWPSPASTPTCARSSAAARTSRSRRPRTSSTGRRWRPSRGPQGPHPARVPPVQPEAAAALLKTIEEPPASTTFVVLADFVPQELVTIASRCVRIDFRTIPDDVLTARLLAEGVDAETVGTSSPRPAATSPGPGCSPATRRSSSAGGRSPSCRAASTAPAATVMRLVDELLAQIDSAAAPLVERQRRRGRRARRPDRPVRRAGQRPQAARGAPQARAAPAPHRRAAQRARRARRHATATRSSPARATARMRSSPPSARIHEAIEALGETQPERAVAPAIAAVVAAGRVRPVARRPAPVRRRRGRRRGGDRRRRARRGR